MLCPNRTLSNAQYSHSGNFTCSSTLCNAGYLKLYLTSLICQHYTEHFIISYINISSYGLLLDTDIPLISSRIRKGVIAVLAANRLRVLGKEFKQNYVLGVPAGNNPITWVLLIQDTRRLVGWYSFTVVCSSAGTVLIAGNVISYDIE